MEDKIIEIQTKISIKQLLYKLVRENPQTKCEFNNKLVYLFTDEFLDKISNQLNNLYVKGGKKHKKTKKRNRQKKTRKIIKQKGGVDPRIVLFFMSFFYVFVKGIKNMTQTDVINRVKQANEVSDIFRNYYGTCTLNTMLFLKTIDLQTFEELSVNMMKIKPGFTSNEMSSYLNSELNIHSRWFSFSARGENEEDTITNYIEKIRSKLIEMRSVYGFVDNQAILTAMNYPKKGKYVGHSVVIWLTNNNEIIIIEPQKFLRNDIILYTSEASYERFMNNDKSLKIEPIRTYIRENIDILNDYRDTDLFESLHIEIYDKYGKNTLDPKNENIMKTISRIKEVEESLKNKGDVEL